MNSNSKTNPETIRNLFQMYCISSNMVSASVLMGPEITQDEIKTYGVSISPKEIPLMMLYKSGMIIKTKLLITDQNIYYKCLKDSFWTGLFGTLTGVNEDKISWNKISSLEIGRHDQCFGTAYVGHQLKINGKVLGLVRMGSGICLDEDAIKILNGFFDFLFKSGILSDAPNLELYYKL